MEEKKFLKIMDSAGNESEYEILCAFELEKTGKNYVVYTDNTKNEAGDFNVFASIYYPNDMERLDSIETEEEWDAVEKRLKSIKY